MSISHLRSFTVTVQGCLLVELILLFVNKSCVVTKIKRKTVLMIEYKHEFHIIILALSCVHKLLSTSTGGGAKNCNTCTGDQSPPRQQPLARGPWQHLQPAGQPTNGPQSSSWAARSPTALHLFCGPVGSAEGMPL